MSTFQQLGNRPRSVFILTTNNIGQWDKGATDRCVLLEMNSATDAEYLPLTRRIASDQGVILSDAQLLAAIAGNNGSFHSVIFSIRRLAQRVAHQNASAASIATATI